MHMLCANVREKLSALAAGQTQKLAEEPSWEILQWCNAAQSLFGLRTRLLHFGTVLN